MLLSGRFLVGFYWTCIDFPLVLSSLLQVFDRFHMISISLCVHRYMHMRVFHIGVVAGFVHTIRKTAMLTLMSQPYLGVDFSTSRNETLTAAGMMAHPWEDYLGTRS